MICDFVYCVSRFLIKINQTHLVPINDKTSILLLIELFLLIEL